MRLVVLACIAAAGCDSLFHLDHVPLPTDAAIDGPGSSNGSDVPNLVFVSSQKIVPATLGGTAAADALCTTLATNAGHPGHYVAWLGTSTESATQRIGATARGWVRADGRPFADTLVDIVQGKVWYPLRLTETGEDIALSGSDADLVVVTATMPSGETQLPNCNDFTTATLQGVTAGLADAAPFGWNANMGAVCSSAARVYCFGVDHTAPVSLVPDSTRLAFITFDAPAAGLAGFDQRCATEAAQAARAGTFRAAVATTSASALARFPNGGPWVRADGVTAVDSAGNLIAPIELDAAGGFQGVAVAWNGATSLVAKAPSSAASCFDWTHVDNTQGLTGNNTRSGPQGFGGIANSCANSLPVYCLQD